jgi:hypothetical protein
MSDVNSNIDPRPGDLLLCMGKSEISKLIAWSADSDYSHAAVVIDPENLIEASLGGVRIISLEAERQLHEHYFFIDTWRSLSTWPHPLTAQNAEALNRIGRHYLNRPYPTSFLPELGIAITVRQKFPEDPAMRYVVRLAMDLAIEVLTKDSDTIMCSELAYRMYMEGEYEPRNLLRPEIIVTPKSDTPFPEINYYELWKEIQQILPHSLRPIFRAALSIPDSATDEAPQPVDAELGWLNAAAYAGVPTDAELAETARRVAEAAQENAKASGLGAIPIPNPKMITPGDLQSSPSFKKVSRFLAG